MSENHFFNFFLLLSVFSIRLGRELSVIEMLCVMTVYLFSVWLTKKLYEKGEAGDKK